MKNTLKKYASFIGCTMHYSGKDKIMYIKGQGAALLRLTLKATKTLSFELVVRGNYPFQDQLD